MMGLETYLLISPFTLLAIAGIATWVLVGRKNAPLGSKANKVGLSTSEVLTSKFDVISTSPFSSSVYMRPQPLQPAPTHEAPRVRQ